MKNWMRIWPAAAVMALALTTAPPVRAADDVGAQMEREYGVIRDTRDNDVLDRVVQKMVRAVNSDKEYSSFQLRSARLLGGRDQKHDKVINAFALPDGRIYVTYGLMRLLDKSREPDDELAFVVGHEITHVVEHHSAKQLKKSLPVNIAAILLGAATGNRAIGTVAGAGAAAYGASFSRKDEYRADRGGLIFMNKAGYNIDAAPTMLGRLKSSGEGSAINAWFGSHPATQSRVDKMEDMVADIHAGRRPNADD